MKLLQERAAAGASAQRQEKEAAELRLKLQEERQRAAEAESSARYVDFVCESLDNFTFSLVSYLVKSLGGHDKMGYERVDSL